MGAAGSVVMCFVWRATGSRESVVTQEERAYRMWFDVCAILERACGQRVWAQAIGVSGVVVQVQLISRKERTGSVAKRATGNRDGVM